MLATDRTRTTLFPNRLGGCVVRKEQRLTFCALTEHQPLCPAGLPWPLHPMSRKPRRSRQQTQQKQLHSGAQQA